jgi:anti-sigma regulatory factor (Ser/Thr protein kinase)
VSSVTLSTPELVTEFRHEALLYRGPDELGPMLLSIIQGAIEAGDSILVAVDADKGARLRAQLGRDAPHVAFVDMRSIGRNPARIIPMWQSFVSAHAGHGKGALGVGEPVWPGRSPHEFEECALHESLLNFAFARGPAWRLVCPYDVVVLAESEIRSAFDTHPVVPGFPSTADPVLLRGVPERFRTPLAEPPEASDGTPFDSAGALAGLRAAVSARALQAGLDVDRARDIVVAVSEVASNSIRYGGGRGMLRMWRTPDAFVCEVRDGGRIDDPLVGRIMPEPLADGRRGLWMVNQLCDLVQVRSLDDGVVVRLHAALTAPRDV